MGGLSAANKSTIGNVMQYYMDSVISIWIKAGIFTFLLRSTEQKVENMNQELKNLLKKKDSSKEIGIEKLREDSSK